MSGNIRINQLLIQFKIAMEHLQSSEICESVLDKLDNYNVKVVPTDYLTLCRPSWIGKTALDFAYNHRSRFYYSYFREKVEKADYTIKNHAGLTSLHLMLCFPGSNKFLFANIRSTLDVPSINEILSTHVQMKNPINPYDSNGMSHFHVACMANHIEAVEFFLDSDVSIDHAINFDSPYFAGFTALHLSIRCCNLEVTKILLKRGANIYLKNNRKTVLHIAVENHLAFANDDLLGCFGSTSDLRRKNANLQITKVLLEIISSNGTKITDDFALSSLHIACIMMDSSAIEEALIKEDINQSIPTDSALWPGYTALHFATLVDCKTVKILVKKGADLLAKDANGITPFDLCMKKYKTDDIYDIITSSSIWKKTETLSRFRNQTKFLNFISAMSNCNQFTTFLDNFPMAAHVSVPISSPLWPGFTPMHLLVYFSHKKYNFPQKEYTTGRTPTTIYLPMMTELHDINENILTAQDNHSQTPLHFSFHLGNMKYVVDLLLILHNKIDVPVDLVDDEDLSLLHIACTKDNELVEKLVLRSKNVNLAYKGKTLNNSIETGWTPLHVAVANNSVNAIKTLLKYGADVHIKDVNGVTPIHLLVLLNDRSSESAENLLSAEMNSSLLSVPNLKECVVENIGLSYLHVACFARNIDAVKKLIASGSNVNLQITSNKRVVDQSFEFKSLANFLGCTPLQIFLNSFPPWFGIILSESRKLGTRSTSLLALLMRHGADIFVEDSDGVPLDYEFLGHFAVELQENDYLQIQVEAKIGLTKLHLACILKDLEWLKNLLQDDVNVNRKLSMHLSRYAGLTPLHIVMETFIDSDEMKNEFVKLLLDHGADITLSDAKNGTLWHMAHNKYIRSSPCTDGWSLCYYYYQQVILLIKAQKDFSVNPTCIKGISHFHIACNMSEIAVVKKFLERGNVDVNQPIDFFTATHKFCAAGFTPLHMAATSDKNYVTIASQLKTVDILLKHGADPNFQNSWGNTPLHLTDRYEIFERIARSGGDVNIINLKGYTPLGHLLTNNFYPEYKVTVSTDQIINWLRCGCYYNAFNIFSEVGYIGLSVQESPFEELQNLLQIVTINMANAVRIDEKGRTMVHNVVSVNLRHSYESDEKNISIIQYATLIEILTKSGCDIDSQDNLGRTALHVATKFSNYKAVSALLMLGADPNIQDKSGKTALAYSSNEYLVVHMRKLQFCQIDVCQSDKSYIDKKCGSININEGFRSELEEIKNVKIGFDQLSLQSFISETGAVADYPFMSQDKRDAIDEFFQEDKICQFREKYSKVAGLLSLQYRKAVARSLLVENARISLNFLANYEIPNLCSRTILGFFSNSDLKNVIASTNNYENQREDREIVSHETSLSKNKKLRIQ